MKQSGLVTAGGAPISSVADGGKPIKAPPPEALAYLFGMADNVLLIEKRAFEMQEGSFLHKLEAARIAEMVTEKVLSREEAKRGAVQLAPHLFARVPIVSVPPAPSKCYVKTHEVRDAFDALMRNGYNGIPILGLSPAQVLAQCLKDGKRRETK